VHASKVQYNKYFVDTVLYIALCIQAFVVQLCTLVFMNQYEETLDSKSHNYCTPITKRTDILLAEKQSLYLARS